MHTFSIQPLSNIGLCSCISADLSKNGVGPKGIGQLCQALTHNQTLQTLLLDTNNLGDEGAGQIASILASKHCAPATEILLAVSAFLN